MTPGAHLRLRLMVGDVRVAFHARGPVGADFVVVRIVASRAVGVAGSLRIPRDLVEARQPLAFVTARAGGRRHDRASMRLVTRCALPVTLWARRLELSMTARACGRLAKHVRRAFVARHALRVIDDPSGHARLLGMAVDA